jgi:hypothetical protein
MSPPRASPPAKSSTPAPAARPSRRGFLGGALALGLAAVLLPADRALVRPSPWKAHNDRWIGHW